MSAAVRRADPAEFRPVELDLLAPGYLRNDQCAADRVTILREAFSKTMKDSDFLAEAKKSGWEIRPTSGEDLQALAREVIDQPPEVVEWLKKLLSK